MAAADLLVLVVLGEAYVKLSDWQAAEFWYREALRVKPDHIPAHLTLAKLLQRQVKAKAGYIIVRSQA